MENIRKSYQKAVLEFAALPQDPFILFQKWWDDIIHTGIEEANAMALATADKSGQPGVRTVLLKGVLNGGFEFYTHYQSAKAKDIEENNKVGLLFFWKELERQVRIEGHAQKVSTERSKEYFQSRPRGSQVGAWASPQSSVIPDRAALDELVTGMEKRFEGQDPLPLPGHWGGYLVIPERIEFWQGRPDRLHDRFRYSQQPDGNWKIERLAP